MIEFPPQLETRRLILRHVESNDAAAVLDAATTAYTELNRWMDWAKTPYGIKEAESYCKDAQRRFKAGTDLPTLIVLREEDKVIGSAALHVKSEYVPSFEIGYWLSTEYTGHGYVTEAGHALTTFAFKELGAQRVQIRLDEKNKKSSGVAKRLGFVHEATFRHDRRDNRGDLANTEFYAVFDIDQLTPLVDKP